MFRDRDLLRGMEGAIECEEQLNKAATCKTAQEQRMQRKKGDFEPERDWEIVCPRPSF